MYHFHPLFDFAGFSRSVGASTIASSGTDRARRRQRGKKKMEYCMRGRKT